MTKPYDMERNQALYQSVKKQTLKDEPTLNGDMPEELFNEFFGDEEHEPPHTIPVTHARVLTYKLED